MVNTNQSDPSGTSAIGTPFSTQLSQLLGADDLEPGSDVSYETAKIIYGYHPIGAKIAEEPINAAQFRPREIAIPDSPDEPVRKEFEKKWEELGCSDIIKNVGTLSRVYGVASLAILNEGVPNERPLDLKSLASSSARFAFNVYDPLNTAGSLVLSQNPRSMNFLKPTGIALGSEKFHPSRAVTLMNESPIYLLWTASSYGYVGRSAYQRVLYPLKSYLQTMRTDDMVSAKAGVIVAKMKQPGSFADKLMVAFTGLKRAIVRVAMTGNVISISPDETIESLNLQNLDGAATMARKNILENIAAGVPMPAKLLLQETFAEGFGEGTEDAKYVARYIDRVRAWLAPLYNFLDLVVMHAAWTPEFYKTIQERYPDSYGSKTYNQAFYEWKNSFVATWPDLLTEPESEKIKSDQVILEAALKAFECLIPMADPDNKARLAQWLADVLNERKKLFSSPLLLDYKSLADYVPPTSPSPLEEPKPGAHVSLADSERIAGSLMKLIEARIDERRRGS